METSSLSRRRFLRSGTIAGASASTIAILRPELVRGAGKEELKIGLVGCGSRGTQAVADHLTGNEKNVLVAMGDVFEDKLTASYNRLQTDPRLAKLQSRIQVDPEHRFTGFDAYKKVIASGVDIVMLCTPPGYRPMHFEAAVEAKKHIFTEKPVGTDPVGVRRFMAAAKKSEELKLTVMAGAQRRSSPEFVDTVQKIHDGAIGEIVSSSASYLATPVFEVRERNPNWGDMEWQHRQWYSFVWICGDQVVEQHFHNLDTMNWVMGAHPIKVVASGGAAWRPRLELYGNIYDHMNSQFVYPNGVVFSSQCRQYPRGRYERIDDLVVGTKGKSNCHDMSPSGMTNIWSGGPPAYVKEHVDMVRSILGDGPYMNRAMAVAESTMTGIMARESAYSGDEVTWDRIMKSELDLMPKSFDYKLKMDVPPLPVPGIYKLI